MARWPSKFPFPGGGGPPRRGIGTQVRLVVVCKRSHGPFQRKTRRIMCYGRKPQVELCGPRSAVWSGSIRNSISSRSRILGRRMPLTYPSGPPQI